MSHVRGTVGMYTRFRNSLPRYTYICIYIQYYIYNIYIYICISLSLSLLWFDSFFWWSFRLWFYLDLRSCEGLGLDKTFCVEFKAPTCCVKEGGWLKTGLFRTNPEPELRIL